MKTANKILTILILSFGLIACADPEMGSMDPELKPYVEELELQSGLTVPSRYNFKIVDDLGINKPNVSALCRKKPYLTEKGKTVVRSILFKRSVWEKLGTKSNAHVLKMHLLTHEFAHCYFNLGHPEHIRIMNPYTMMSQSYTMEDYINDLNQLLNEVRK